MRAYLKACTWGLQKETLGLWLGVLGVVIFALTLPMTRLATGTADAPQLSPWFVTFGRAALAGFLSVAVLLVIRAPWPTAAQRRPLLFAVLGNVIGFPLLLALALRQVTSGHAAVIMALLPLATAAMAAWVLHHRARLGFWVCAVLGSGVVMVYSFLRAYQTGHGFGLEWADLLLLLAVLVAAMGYVYGAVDPSARGGESDLLGVRDSAAYYFASGSADLAYAACGLVGLGCTAVCRHALYVGGLFCMVSRSGAGWRAQGKPDATSAALFQHFGGSALAG
jgi:drug/metabolite transporter (DMT)-like permease